MDGNYDAFDETNEDIDMPELDQRIDAQSDQLEKAAGDEETGDILNKSSDRRLLSTADPWAEPVKHEQPEQQEATPGQDEQAKLKPEAPPSPPVKSVSFKAGEQAIDVPESAVLSVKVDGKTVDVPVAELMSNYSGKVAWDRRFSELTNEKRAFAAEKQKLVASQQSSQQVLQNLHKSIGSGDTFGAIASLVSIAGLEGKLDPRKYVAELRNALYEQASRMAQLTPEERAQIEAREEFEYTKKQLAEMRQAREREQSEYQAQQSFARKLVEHKLQAEDLQRGYDYLLANGSTHGIDASKLSPDELLQYTLTVREFETAIGALKDVSQEAAENRQFQDEAVKMLRAYPGTTREQLTEIFREALGQKRSEAVSKKVTKTPVSTPATAKLAKATQQPGTKKPDDLVSRIQRKSDVWDF